MTTNGHQITLRVADNFDGCYKLFPVTRDARKIAIIKVVGWGKPQHALRAILKKLGQLEFIQAPLRPPDPDVVELRVCQVTGGKGLKFDFMANGSSKEVVAKLEIADQWARCIGDLRELLKHEGKLGIRLKTVPLAILPGPGC